MIWKMSLIFLVDLSGLFGLEEVEAEEYRSGSSMTDATAIVPHRGDGSEVEMLEEPEFDVEGTLEH